MALHAAVHAVTSLTADQREAMFAVMTRYFDGVQRAVFEADLAEKEWAFLLTDDGVIHGFSTLRILPATVKGVPVRAFFSGDTVLDRDYWASLALEQAWILFTARRVLAMPEYRWFWFLISNSYRSFRYLPVYAKRYYPHPTEPTPPFEQAVLDTLAGARYGDGYDPATGTITLPEGSCLRPGVGDITPQELRDPRIAFFQTRNPHWRDGVELACLAEFSPDNFQPATLRQFRRLSR